jgi:hypothetical protein
VRGPGRDVAATRRAPWRRAEAPRAERVILASPILSIRVILLIGDPPDRRLGPCVTRSSPIVRMTLIEALQVAPDLQVS